jgi:acetyltransferase-like isoleucine patch superfamily enzyme
LIRDHRPYFVKKLYLRFERAYIRRYIGPQLTSLGRHPTFMKPWYVEIFGAPIRIGHFATVIAATDSRVRISVWRDRSRAGRIDIGDHVMLCPGTRISSAAAITIRDNCMIAGKAYITDCDWHDVYNRIGIGKAESICIHQNVWVGDSAIICKGVTIGENSIIGAGAVVTGNIPANTIAAGNPARVVRHLEPTRRFTTRARWFADPPKLFADIDQLDRDMLKGNTLLHWLRYLLRPGTGE